MALAIEKKKPSRGRSIISTIWDCVLLAVPHTLSPLAALYLRLRRQLLPGGVRACMCIGGSCVSVCARYAVSLILIRRHMDVARARRLQRNTSTPLANTIAYLRGRPPRLPHFFWSLVAAEAALLQPFYITRSLNKYTGGQRGRENFTCAARLALINCAQTRAVERNRRRAFHVAGLKKCGLFLRNLMYPSICACKIDNYIKLNFSGELSLRKLIAKKKKMWWWWNIKMKWSILSTKLTIHF